MKSKLTHKERQALHSYELGIHNERVKEAKIIHRYQQVGWMIVIVWTVFSIFWAIFS